MFAAKIHTQPSFRAGSPQLLFQGRYWQDLFFRSYDVAPDGRRFLMIALPEQEQSPATQFNVVVNWFEDLKRLAPARR